MVIRYLIIVFPKNVLLSNCQPPQLRTAGLLIDLIDK